MNLHLMTDLEALELIAPYHWAEKYSKSAKRGQEAADGSCLSICASASIVSGNTENVQPNVFLRWTNIPRLQGVFGQEVATEAAVLRLSEEAPSLLTSGKNSSVVEY